MLKAEAESRGVSFHFIFSWLEEAAAAADDNAQIQYRRDSETGYSLTEHLV